MKNLLKMVDEILRAEAYTNDGEIPTFSNPPTNFSCAFCRGEVFQKVFCCKNECLTGETVGPTPTNVSICPACYVDGRTCFCGKMVPFRLRSIEPMVASRNRVAIWFKRSTKDLLLTDDSEDDTDADAGRRDVAELSVVSLSSCS